MAAPAKSPRLLETNTHNCCRRRCRRRCCRLVGVVDVADVRVVVLGVEVVAAYGVVVGVGVAVVVVVLSPSWLLCCCC